MADDRGRAVGGSGRGECAVAGRVPAAAVGEVQVGPVVVPDVLGAADVNLQVVEAGVLRAGGGKAVCHELEAISQAQLLEAGGDFLLGVEAVGLAFGGCEGQEVERIHGAAAHVRGKRTDFAVGVGGGEGGPIAAATFVVDGAFRQSAGFIVGLAFMGNDFAVLVVLRVSNDLAIAIFVRQGGDRCFGIHLAVAIRVSVVFSSL